MDSQRALREQRELDRELAQDELEDRLREEAGNEDPTEPERSEQWTS